MLALLLVSAIQSLAQDAVETQDTLPVQSETVRDTTIESAPASVATPQSTGSVKDTLETDTAGDVKQQPAVRDTGTAAAPVPSGQIDTSMAVPGRSRAGDTLSTDTSKGTLALPPPKEKRTPTTPGKPYGEVTFKEGEHPHVIIETEFGRMTFELWPEVALQHCQSFVHLARSGFYDSLTFHRIVPEFVIQGGSPTGGGDGGPGYTIPAEFSNRKHESGTLSMARSQNVNSAGSQFFICLNRAPHLDGQFTILGKLQVGTEVLQAIGKAPVDSLNHPVDPIYIRKLYVEGEDPDKIQSPVPQQTPIQADTTPLPTATSAVNPAIGPDTTKNNKATVREP